MLRHLTVLFAARHLRAAVVQRQLCGSELLDDYCRFDGSIDPIVLLQAYCLRCHRARFGVELGLSTLPTARLNALHGLTVRAPSTHQGLLWIVDFHHGSLLHVPSTLISCSIECHLLLCITTLGFY